MKNLHLAALAAFSAAILLHAEFMKKYLRWSCFIFVAGGLVVGSWAEELPERKKAALELTVETSKRVFKTGEPVSFAVTFRNTGINQPWVAGLTAEAAKERAAFNNANNLFLNGGGSDGGIRGDGLQAWSGLSAEIKTASGQQLSLLLDWELAFVAGRFDSLGVPLRAGSSYVLLVTQDDFVPGGGGGRTFKPGIYELRFVFRGQPFRKLDAGGLPAPWLGEVFSNSVKFEVL